MDEILNNRHKEIFLRLLTNPADTGGVYLVNLQELVKAYPQSGLLRAMYGRALNESNPIVAGGYFDNRALHKLLYHHDSLLPVSESQLVQQGDKKLNGNAAIKEVAETVVPGAVLESAPVVTEAAHIFTDQPANFPDVLKGHEPESRVEEIIHTQPALETVAGPVAEIPAHEPVVEEPSGRAPWETEEAAEEVAPVAAAVTEPEYVHPAHQEPTHEPVKEEVVPEPVIEEVKQPVYEHVYEPVKEEIAPEPVIEETKPHVQEPVLAPVVENTPWEQIAEEYAASIAAQSNGQAAYHTPVEPVAEETHQLNGNAVDTNFFALDNGFVEHKNGSTELQAMPEPAKHEQNGAAHNDVSKYHDEKMPYSFMWWLDKTRREHDATYQPYAKTANDNENGMRSKTDDLQQQYFENIFHLSPDTLVRPAEAQTVEFNMQNKEDRIIKRFITEDPHIHPPLGEKLDTENKARRSSEDEYDMVTETLARIYADQMLFPKAIATYRKLMLKFPEKSRYFASRIDALEKRTN